MADVGLSIVYVLGFLALVLSSLKILTLWRIHLEQSRQEKRRPKDLAMGQRTER